MKIADKECAQKLLDKINIFNDVVPNIESFRQSLEAIILSSSFVKYEDPSVYLFYKGKSNYCKFTVSGIWKLSEYLIADICEATFSFDRSNDFCYIDATCSINDFDMKYIDEPIKLKSDFIVSFSEAMFKDDTYITELRQHLKENMNPLTLESFTKEYYEKLYNCLQDFFEAKEELSSNNNSSSEDF
jgi:hypothetical protein